MNFSCTRVENITWSYYQSIYNNYNNRKFLIGVCEEDHKRILEMEGEDDPNYISEFHQVVVI